MVSKRFRDGNARRDSTFSRDRTRLRKYVHKRVEWPEGTFRQTLPGCAEWAFYIIASGFRVVSYFSTISAI